VALLRTGVSEERVGFIIRVRIGKLGATLSATSNGKLCEEILVTANVPSSPIFVTLMMEAISSFEMSVLTRATQRNIPEDGVLHSHCRENLKSYIALTGWVL
jgi:hypothetical protein